MQPHPSRVQVLALTALTLFTVWIHWQAKRLEMSLLNSDTASALYGKPAPDFQLSALDGSTVSLADYRGKKKLVLNFWASWCGPCRLEMPMLQEFYRKAHKEDSKFEFLAISIDDDPEEARRFAEKAGLPFPVLLDPEGKTAKAYSVRAIPATFVIDEEGTVISAHTGLQPGLDYVLSIHLGIKDYSPARGASE